MTKFVAKKRPLLEWLTIFLFVYPFLLATMLQLMKLPNFMKYLMDAAWCTVVLLTLSKGKIRLRKNLVPFLRLIGIFLLYTLIVYLFNYQSGIYYLWGFRNTFRYYMAFIAFAMYLQENDAEDLLGFVDKLFWINAIVTFFQFFVLGYKQDFLGGIFGIAGGSNGTSLIFFVLVISKSLLAYMNGHEGMINCFMKSGVALIIAAMAEIKFFFLLYAVILALAAMFSKFSLRKFWMILAAAFLLSVGSSLLVSIFGSSMRLSFDFLAKQIFAKSYSSSNDLGRFTAIPVLSKSILTDWTSRLFGLGLGNCETSSFAICNTPFFKKYEYLHYTWFTSAFLYLETGFVGLGMYLSFFLTSFRCAIKETKKETANLRSCQLAMIMAVSCAILTFYNSSLRIEVGYIAYFVLALPLMGRNQRHISA